MEDSKENIIKSIYEVYGIELSSIDDVLIYALDDNGESVIINISSCENAQELIDELNEAFSYIYGTINTSVGVMDIYNIELV